MFDSIRKRRDLDAAVSIDMTPLIDVVFILLLFFLVTTTFVKETGIEVSRPQASLSSSVDADSIRIGLAASGGIYLDGARVDLALVHEAVSEKTTTNSEVAVVVIPDERVPGLGQLEPLVILEPQAVVGLLPVGPLDPEHRIELRRVGQGRAQALEALVRENANRVDERVRLLGEKRRRVDRIESLDIQVFHFHSPLA